MGYHCYHMGQSQLEENLNALLLKGISTESDTIYLLVEIRKLFDVAGYSDPHLRMFCNWAVHTELTVGNSGSTDLLKEIDDQLIKTIELKLPQQQSQHYSF